MPTAESATAKMAAVVMAWRSTWRAPTLSLAPMRCATCTEKPVMKAKLNPPKSQMVVDTNPTDAASLAPRRPSIEASMYCIRNDESWASMAGALSLAVSVSCWRSVIGLPSRISESRASLEFCSIVLFIVCKVTKETVYRANHRRGKFFAQPKVVVKKSGRDQRIALFHVKTND